MNKARILFVCIHNIARSQMAEGIVNHYYGGRFTAESAGFEAGNLNPFAVKAMKDIGIDISQYKTKKVNPINNGLSIRESTKQVCYDYRTVSLV